MHTLHEPLRWVPPVKIAFSPFTTRSRLPTCVLHDPMAAETRLTTRWSHYMPHYTLPTRPNSLHTHYTLPTRSLFTTRGRSLHVGAKVLCFQRGYPDPFLALCKVDTFPVTFPDYFPDLESDCVSSHLSRLLSRTLSRALRNLLPFAKMQEVPNERSTLYMSQPGKKPEVLP